MNAIPITPRVRPDEWRFDALPPLSLYVHLPWCIKKCPYCDFNSYAIYDKAGGGSTVGGLSDQLEKLYVTALLQDLEQTLPWIWGRPIQSIFFGGGTPSLFQPESIAALLSQFRSLLPVLPGAEITLEANPGTFEQNRFKGFQQAGINRLSLGIQTFNDRHLKSIGRVHDSAIAQSACGSAKSLFDRLNIDLMYGLPGQSLDDLLSDLSWLKTFDPGHVSLYQLTIEPNTQFAKYPPSLPDDDVLEQMFGVVMQMVSELGYRPYETSAFARAGHRCDHNLNYWMYGDYIGIGAGAHGKITFHDRIVRTRKLMSPKDYIEKVGNGWHAYTLEEMVPAKQVPYEFFMNAFRLHDGIAKSLFRERTGLTIETILPQIESLMAKGLLVDQATRWVPTDLGRRFVNDMVLPFLVGSEDGLNG